MIIDTTVPVRVVVTISDTDPMRCGACKFYGLNSFCKLYKSKIINGMRRPGCIKDIQLDRPRDIDVPAGHWHLYKNHGFTEAQLLQIIALGDGAHDVQQRCDLAERWKSDGLRPKQTFGDGDVWSYGYGLTNLHRHYVYQVASND